VRHRGFHIFYTNGSETAMRLLALRAASVLTSVRFLVPIPLRGGVNSRAIVWLEGLDTFKKIQ
jgi:hypothetical protein